MERRSCLILSTAAAMPQYVANSSRFLYGTFFLHAPLVTAFGFKRACLRCKCCLEGTLSAGLHTCARTWSSFEVYNKYTGMHLSTFASIAAISSKSFVRSTPCGATLVHGRATEPPRRTTLMVADYRKHHSPQGGAGHRYTAHNVVFIT